MQITLYQATYKKTDVKKNTSILSYVTVNGALRYPTNDLNPIIRIDRSEFDPQTSSHSASINAMFYPSLVINYLYAPELGGRYYFIVNKVFISNTIIDLYLHVDVLQTYIGKSNAPLRSDSVFVERNEYDFNKLLEDYRVPYYKDKNISYKEVTNYSVTKPKLIDNNPGFRNFLLVCVTNANVYSFLDLTKITPSQCYYPTTLNIDDVYARYSSLGTGIISFLLTWEQFNEVARYALSNAKAREAIIYAGMFPFDLDGVNAEYMVYNTNSEVIWGDVNGALGTEKFVANVGSYGGGIIHACSVPILNYEIFKSNISDFIANFNLPSGDDFEDSYLLYNGKSKYELYIPYVGFTDIEYDILSTATKIRVMYNIDPANGNSSAVILLDGVPYKTVKCLLNSDINLSSTNAYENNRKKDANLTQAIGTEITGAIMLIGGIILSCTGYGTPAGLPMALAGGATMLGGGVNLNAQNMQILTDTYKGGITSAIDGLLGLQKFILRITRVKPTANIYTDAFLSENGRPLKENRTVSNLLGYTELGKCDFNIGSQEEEKELSELLMSGVHFPTTPNW